MKVVRIIVSIVIKTVTNVKVVLISGMVLNANQSVLQIAGEMVPVLMKRVYARCVLLDTLGHHALGNVVNGVTRATFVTRSLDNVKTAKLEGMDEIVWNFVELNV